MEISQCKEQVCLPRQIKPVKPKWCNFLWGCMDKGKQTRLKSLSSGARSPIGIVYTSIATAI